MKFVMKKNGIEIIPENEQDEAYIEDTLKLRREGDSLPITIGPYYLGLLIWFGKTAT